MIRIGPKVENKHPNFQACAIVGLKFCAINRRLAAKQRVGQAAGQLISGAPTINQNQNGPGHVESCHLSQDQQNYEGLKVKPALLMKFKQEDCCSFFCQIVSQRKQWL